MRRTLFSFLLMVIISVVLSRTAKATVYSWTNTMAAGGLWSEASRWTNDAAPASTASGDTLDFSTRDITANMVVTNDLTGVRAGIIKLGDAATAFQFWTLRGNPIELDNGVSKAVIDVAPWGAASSVHAITNQLTGTSGLQKTGPGILSLPGAGANTFGGDVEINGGELRILNGGNLGVSSNTVTFSGGGQLTETGAGVSLTNGIIINAGVTATNSNANAVSMLGVIGGDGSLVKVGAGVMTLTNANTYAGMFLANSGPIRADDGMGVNSGNVTLASAVWEFGLDPVRTRMDRAPGMGGNQVSLTGASPGFSAYTNDVTVNFGDDGRTLIWGSSDFNPVASLVLNSATASNRLTLMNSLDLGSTGRTITVNALLANAGAAVEVAGGLTMGATGMVTKAGPGVLVLNPGSANTFPGRFVIAGGVLRADDGWGMSAAGNAMLSGGVWESGMDSAFTNITRVVGAGANQVQLTNSAGFSAYGHDVTVSLGGDPAAALTWGGASFGPANFILNEGTANSKLTFRNPLALGNVARTISVNANVAELAGDLSGYTNVLTKGGAGTLILSGNNAATTNKITVSAGTLQIDSITRLGSSPGGVVAAQLTLNDGTLKTTGNVTVDVNRGITLGTSDGWLDVAAGTTLAIDSKISGVNPIYKQGGGILALNNAANTNSTITMYAGTLQVATNGALGATAAGLTFASNATLKASETFATPGGANRPIVISSGVTAALDVDNGQTLTWGGIISGASGNLTKTGPGTLALTNANTYAGATVVEQGTLQIGLARERIANASPVIIRNGAIFDLQTFSETVGAVTLMDGMIAGSGMLTGAVYNVERGIISAGLGGAAMLNKSTTNRVTLAGANTYSGATTVSNGTLFVNGSLSASSTVTVAVGTLSGGGACGATIVNGGGMINPGDGTGDRTLNASSLTLSATNSRCVFEFGMSTNDQIVLSGALNVSNGGEIYLNNDGGGVFVTRGGPYPLIQCSNGNGLITTLGTPEKPDGVNYVFSIASGWLVVEISGVAAWNGGSTMDSNWTSADNWGGSALADFAALTFAGIERVANTNDFTGYTVGGITFDPAAGSFVLSGNAVNLLGPLVNRSPLAQVIDLPLVLVSSTREIDASSGDITISREISDGAASLGIVKSGGRTLMLMAGNTYDGLTTITAGSVNIQDNNALGSTNGGTTVNGGAALQLQGDVTTAAEPLILNGVGVAGDGALENVSGANIYAGNIMLGSASRIEATGGSLTLDVAAGNAISAGSTAAVTFGGTGDITVNDPIAAPVGMLNKTGAGTLALGAPNTYTGATTIATGGAIQIRHPNALGAIASRTVVDSGGALQINGALGNIAAEPLTLNGLGIGGTNGALRNLGGASTCAGAITLGSTSRINSDAGTLALNPSASPAITGPGDLTFGGEGNITVSKTITAPVGTLTKDGGGMLTIGIAANTYTGATIIVGGTLKKGITGDLIPNGSALIVDGVDAVFDNSTFSETMGAVLLKNGTIKGAGLLTGAGYTVENGTISSPLGPLAPNTLTKDTPGTVALAGAGTFTGLTTINDGTLSVSHATALGAATTARVLFTGNSNAKKMKINGVNITLTGLNGDGNSMVENSTNTALLTVNIAAGTTNVFDGVLQDNGGTLALTKGVAGTLALGGSNTYSGATTISLGTLRLGAPEVIPSGTGKGNVAVTTANTCILDMNGFSETINGLSGAGKVDNVSAGGNVALTLGDNNQSTMFSGTITNTSGVVSLTKIGSGTFTMTTLASTYGGPTAIRDGAINVQLADALPAGTVLTLGNDITSGKLILGAATTGRNQTLAGLYTSGTGAANAVVGGATAVSTLTLNIAGGTTNTFAGMLGGSGTNENILALTKSGAGTLVLAGSNTYGNATTIGTTRISAGTLSIDSEARLGTTPAPAADADRLMLDGGTLQATADISLDVLRGVTITTNDGTFDVAETKTLAVDGLVTAPAGCDLHKAGGGTLALNGANTTVLVGTKYVDAGALRLGHAAALGSTASQTMVAPGAALDLNGQTVVLLAPVTLNSTGVSDSGALVNNNMTPATLPGPITLAGDSSVGGSGYMTLSGVIGESGGIRSLTKVGAGTLTLAGAAANTYSGTTFVNEGVLQLGAGNKLADSSDVTVCGGTFGLQTFNDTVDGVTLIDGSITSTSGTLTANTFDVRKGTISAKFAGGAAVLTKTTPDTVILTSAGNSYGGGTIVSGGILQVTSLTGTSTGAGAITIGNGGTLDARGMVSGTTLDVQAGGTLTGNGKVNVSGAVTVDGSIAPGIPGVAGGALTMGSAASLTLNAGSTSAFKINGSLRDMIAVNKRGGLIINGGQGAAWVNLYDEAGAPWTPVEGIYNLITYSGAIGGAGIPALDVGNKAAGQNYLFDTDGSHVRLVTSTAQIVSIGNASVTEGNAGDTPQLVFAVTVSPAPATELAVDFNTSDGTAKAGAPDNDYVATNGTLHIPAGATSGQIAVTVHGDVAPENSETLTVILSNCSAGGYMNGTGTGTIIDDDNLGNICYVRANATGGGTGFSWNDAFTSLQDALAAASPPWSIWVAEGTYTPGTLPSDTFALTPGVDIYGGFAGSESSLNQRNIAANPTILSGDLGGNDTGSWGNRTDNAMHVVTGAGSATLDGFIISGGYANGAAGAGLDINGTSPSIRNCVFTGNRSEGPGLADGGAVSITNSAAPAFVNCVFSGNYASQYGGAVNCLDSSPTFDRCVFAGGHVGDNGGAMFFDGVGSPVVRDCLFAGNYSSYFSGAVRVDNSAGSVNLSLVNCTFSGNHADQFVGSVYVKRVSVAMFKNSISWGNSAVMGNNELSASHGGIINASFSDVEGGYAGVADLDIDPLFSNAPGGLWAGVGPFNAATRQTKLTAGGAGWTPNAFAGMTLNPNTLQYLQYYIVTNDAVSVTVWGDATAAGATVGSMFQINNYRLQEFSPCVDMGTSDGVSLTDLADAPRRQGGEVDMGAYELGIIAVPLPGLILILK
jgi:fibronectin-binding autotransporter adhesin